MILQRFETDPQNGSTVYEEALRNALAQISVVSLREATLTENRGQGAFICDHRTGKTHATPITALQKFVWLLSKREKSLLVLIDVIMDRFEEVTALEATYAIADLMRGGFLVVELNRAQAGVAEQTVFSS